MSFTSPIAEENKSESIKKSRKSKKKKEAEEVKKVESEIDFEKFKISNRYQLLKYIGAGSFGEIHLAYDTHSKKAVCLKFELNNLKMPQLKHEYGVINSINEEEKQEGFPSVFAYEKDSKSYSYMVLEFLGPSLSDLLSFCGGKFSVITVCLIAIQIITRIETLHEKGFLHRDLKPENFLIGINDRSNLVHMIDFGLAKRYKNNLANIHHIPYKENKLLVGTARYASINSHVGVEISRRDDIESLVYILVYFFRGKLPWQSQGNNEDKEMKRVIEKKIRIAPEILCEGLPKQFAYLLHYCKNLKFEDRPDYTLLKNLMNEALLSLVEFEKLEIIIDTDSNGVGRSPNKSKKFHYAQLINLLDRGALPNFDSAELYLTNHPNIVFINKEFTFLFDWQINPQDKDTVYSKFNKKFTMQSRIQEEKSESNFSVSDKSDSDESSVHQKIHNLKILSNNSENENSREGIELDNEIIILQQQEKALGRKSSF